MNPVIWRWKSNQNFHIQNHHLFVQGSHNHSLIFLKRRKKRLRVTQTIALSPHPMCKMAGGKIISLAKSLLTPSTSKVSSITTNKNLVEAESWAMLSLTRASRSMESILYKVSLITSSKNTWIMALPQISLKVGGEKKTNINKRRTEMRMNTPLKVDMFWRKKSVRVALVKFTLPLIKFKKGK